MAYACSTSGALPLSSGDLSVIVSVGGPKIDVMIESISSAVYASGVDCSPELRVVKHCMSEGGGEMGMLGLSRCLICFRDFSIAGANSAIAFLESSSPSLHASSSSLQNCS